MGLVESMASQVAKDIGSKTREFYEFVLPPVDMVLSGDSLSVIIDIPGFDKKDIQISLEENILSIQASKQASEKDGELICNQRPDVISKKVRLPVYPDGEQEMSSAKYERGVLTVIVPVQRSSKNIEII